MVATPTVGVLALQGAFESHARALSGLGVDVTEVRTPDQLATVDALIMPGGESTTMSMLLESSGLFDPLAERLDHGLAVLGTCAGMILLADGIEGGRADQRSFAAIDIDVSRNAYGRQIESFEADLTVDGLNGVFPAVFIRAPQITRLGTDVEVLASHEGLPVLCRSGSVLVAAFHPELSGDDRIHRLFLEQVVAGA
ncbi:MAG: pyridoxal 5'-phosphate synthase glutaminase subunit PdxT [Acidimicrobiales bacterium]|nr:pyridoxal 5'-phosphate synthase glutaminase subunit PdxT [Acidimicrobiales bacterium]